MFALFVKNCPKYCYINLKYIAEIKAKLILHFPLLKYERQLLDIAQQIDDLVFDFNKANQILRYFSKEAAEKVRLIESEPGCLPCDFNYDSIDDYFTEVDLKIFIPKIERFPIFDGESTY